ncbi:helix-turn-helix transcriptional regulator [Falsarthrobacter nasiphocae]|uniref:helix-turn-helix transcriptional regulator n=1 Tax=Falsarthrobacter nasiphocae TaxID=189863 RepID=UPI00286C7606|nr:winged helix-turn-helix transcriptional regulator [Falsarthrobacter nasiphocae]
MDTDAETGTRERVLAAVLTHGPVSALELARMLGLTPAAIRRHLDALQKEDSVEVKLVRGEGGAGRPARRFVASKRSHEGLDDDYAATAAAALRTLGEVGGAEAVRRFARDRFERMGEKYAPRVEAAGPDIDARAQALVEALTEDGFVGTKRDVGLGLPPAMKSVQVCQGHCPILELAAEFPEFCAEETDVFAKLLGVDVRRLSTLATGGHVCTTHVPIGRRRDADSRRESAVNHQMKEGA